MKACYANLLLAGALAGISCAAGAQQSGITIYGIVDIGVTRVSDANGKPLLLLDSGVMQGNRLGFKGVEDLGDGVQALFQLENGFSLDTGALGQGGLMFGRQAWIGLMDARLGTLSAGRQYDFMTDLERFYTPTWSAGGYANHPLDNDRLSGQRVDNSIKYMTSAFAGIQLGAMLGLAEGTDSLRGQNRSYSFTALYENGAFGAGAAYTAVSGRTLDIAAIVGASEAVNVGGDSQRVWGAGAKYAFSQVTVYGLYSQAVYRGSSSAMHALFRNYDLGIAYRAAAGDVYGVGYVYTTLAAKKYGQLNLTADHFLSARSDIYAQVILQQARGAGASANIISLPAAAGNRQLLLRIGMRHKF